MIEDAALEDLVVGLKGVLRGLGAPASFEPEFSRPRDPEHGDWASNAALILAKQLGQPPRDIAERVCELLDLDAAGVSAVDVAGPGFLNFRISDMSIWPRVAQVLEHDLDWGRSDASTGRRVNVEFVSANPTGPLHVAHGRGAVLGDAVASLLEWAGDDVTREFYVNDAGRQIQLLAESVEVRFEQSRGRVAEIPEGGYHGTYVADVARAIEEEEGADELEAMEPAARRVLFEARAVSMLRDEQADDLREFGVDMDLFFSERSLYDSGAVDRLLERLGSLDFRYDEDGATWLRTTKYGDEKDRVLIKSDGSYTYFLPDLAYHLDKAERGFELAIDVWGADHQGHEKRMLAGLAGLEQRDLLEVLIIQLVTVMQGGEEARMSKRAGNFVSLRDLVDKTGPDVARYFFLMRRPEVHLNFDLDLALDTSETNPVYKVQYAHARLCSIFRKGEVTATDLASDADGLNELDGVAERDVAVAVLRFANVMETAASARAPHSVCAYLEELAGLLNSWYHRGNLDPEQRILAVGSKREGRLKLARAVQITLRNGLTALGLSAPETLTREGD